MNLGEIKTAVQRLFGDDSEAFLLESDIVRWANDAQVDIVRKTEALQGTQEIAWTAEDESHSYSTDILYVKRARFDGVKVHPSSMEQVDAIQADLDNPTLGQPDWFYPFGGEVYLYPVPASSGTLKLWYIKRPATLAVDADVPEIPLQMHEDIVRYCYARAKEMNEEEDVAQTIMGDYEARIGQSRDEANHPHADSYPAIRTLPGDEGY